KHVAPVVGIDDEVFALRNAGLADERSRKTVLVPDVVEAVPALHAEPARVRRALLALHEQNLVVLDVIRELTADAAVRTARLDLVVGDGRADARGHQRSGRARLHALAARDAGGGAHRVVEIEHDLRLGATERIADDVVHLRFTARANAPSALDARVEMHG